MLERRLLTESEWLESTNPLQMILQMRWWPLRRRRAATNRKLRLYGCACCRRIWDKLPHQNNRDAVSAVESFPDADWEYPPLWQALGASTAVEFQVGNQPIYWAVKYLGRSYYKSEPEDIIHAVAQKTAQAADLGKDAENEVQAQLLRDILGNPFRPRVIDPAWLTWRDGMVPNLARLIYDERAFHHLPDLADALECAGCANADILTHCRGPGPHVLGCWVIDGLLGQK